MMHQESTPGGPDSGLLITVQHRPSPGFLSLCWKVFFESRGRGISTSAHFPWIHKLGAAYFVTLGTGVATYAGLAVKYIDDASRHRRGGAIGLVCVDDVHRGKGYSTLILERAISHAEDVGLADLVLWTGKPGVYERHGFQPQDKGVFGFVTSANRAEGVREAMIRSEWPEASELRGLPPFAEAGERWRTGAASAIVLHDANGPILAEWNGAESAVADLLHQAMPSTWRINAFADDVLLRVLAQREWKASLRPSNLQMVRPLQSDSPTQRDYDLRVLDRI